ncbi:LOW QUALITY PROTEIN: hypothetical protein PHMEG_0009562 [Phytophthora megakarya]|uniref:Uncharacterized protein n=1 Tax=Phytophthora megakarya TaxID=4795 RepID=A0A225WFX1_9STRA|nr:LOW QUALITY PROTEIN: hypothetical protein PHMEG_0009562 [Phytophthora megakarya]
MLEALETRDVRGNRALHLALKFAHRNTSAIVMTLLFVISNATCNSDWVISDAGARVRSRDTEGWKAIYHAVASENEEVLRLLIRRVKAQAPALQQKKIDDICPRLADVPDYLESSSGYSLRCHVGWFCKWHRKFLCLDHKENTCTELLQFDNVLTESDLDEMVQFFLMTTSTITTDFNASIVTFEKKCGWFPSTPMLQDISSWKATRVVDMTGVEASPRYRKPKKPEHCLPNLLTKELSLLTEATAVADNYTQVVIAPKSNHIV